MNEQLDYNREELLARVNLNCGKSMWDKEPYFMQSWNQLLGIKNILFA